MEQKSDRSTLVSVVVPCFQTPAELLHQALESVPEGAGQSGGKLCEVIVIVDGARGEKLASLKRVLESFPDCKVLFHEKNQGLAAARSSGVAAASGRYIFFLDADDRIAPSGIRLLLDAALTSGAEIVDGVILAITDSRATVHRSNQDFGIDYMRRKTLRAETSFMMQGSLYSRKILTPETMNAGHTYPHEDAITRVNALMAAQSHKTLPFPTYFYLRRPGTLSSSRASDRFLGFLHALERWHTLIGGVHGRSPFRHPARYGGRRILLGLICQVPTRTWKGYWSALKSFPGAMATVSLSSSFSLFILGLRRLALKKLNKFLPPILRG